MKILVVNDDSIHAPGIAVLARAAMELGEVWVVAPAHQCSAMSQKLTIRGTLTVEAAAEFPVPVRAAYQVDGTPADCVKVALRYIMDEKPDYVLSGINDGYNVGFDIAHSGTVGAAFEAVMNGIPAMAVSSGADAAPEVVAQHLVPIARELMHTPLGRGEVWNVNFPGAASGDLKGILRERSVAPVQLYREGYVRSPLPNGSIGLSLRGTPLTAADPLPPGSDMEAVLKGYISIGKVRCVVL